MPTELQWQALTSALRHWRLPPGGLPGLLRRGGARALRLALPASCALCGCASDEALCEPCERQFFGPDSAVARCIVCANPLPQDVHAADGVHIVDDEHAADHVPGVDHVHAVDSVRDVPAPGAAMRCGACLARQPAFDATLVAASYAAPLDQLVLQLKFGQRLALAPLFARLLRDALLQQPGFVLPALLCPVPLGPHRLAERGYNQALEIARPLARALGVPLYPRLASRVRDTRAQSGVAPDQRQQNIASAFGIADGALVQGRHIGLVDDVMTSGRTLDELAATFKRYGATRVSNLVFARTPPH